MTRSYVYRGLSRADIDPAAIKRFWSKVAKSDGCWLWTAARTRGYGQACIGDGRVDMAHKVAYVLRKGDIPPRMTIGQTCGNRACVRPAHLRMRTFAERQWANSKLGLEGAQHTRAIAPVATYSELANLYEVTVGTVSSANNNHTYHDPKHVPHRPWSHRKYSAQDAEDMRAAYDDGERIDDLMTEYGLAFSTVWMIVHPEVKRVKIDGQRVTVRVDA